MASSRSEAPSQHRNGIDPSLLASRQSQQLRGKSSDASSSNNHTSELKGRWEARESTRRVRTSKNTERASTSTVLAREGGEARDGAGDPSFVVGAVPSLGPAGHRRGGSEAMKPHSNDHSAQDYRRSSISTHVRDTMRRSHDTSAPDTPMHAERGETGREGNSLVARDSPVHGGAERAVSRTGGGGGGGDKERNSLLVKLAGDEDLPLEEPGRYERMRVLGRGSFGAVTLVKDRKDSKLYAMKTLNCGDKSEERQMAMEEVRLLRSLKHPTILTLFDTFLSADGRLVCLTTTYCESGDLAKIVKHAAKTKSPLGEKTVLGWFAQLCLGVHHLHEEQKVLHRDIKPSNVFLMESKKIVQLGDFGLAKVIGGSDKQVKAEVGTPYYTSPEMCNNQPYGFPSDVWSLGVVLFELLALDVPFRSRDVVVLVSQVIKAPPPPLPDVYSDETAALARWMLQKDPQRRPTLTQVLSCQPLRRHMNAFVKNYRPMNMAERQRRNDIKDLEAQVSSILEQGGEDPKIPEDLDAGCGTLLPVSSQDGATAIAESRDQGLSEARSEVVQGSARASCGVNTGRGGGTDADSSATRATTRAATAPCDHTVNLPSLDTCETSKGAATISDGLSEVAGDGGIHGGGNSTPGRRFGSPKPSKGLRSVMSWVPGNSKTVNQDPEEGSDESHGNRLRGSRDRGGIDDGASGSHSTSKTSNTSKNSNNEDSSERDYRYDIEKRIDQDHHSNDSVLADGSTRIVDRVNESIGRETADLQTSNKGEGDPDDGPDASTIGAGNKKDSQGGVRKEDITAAHCPVAGQNVKDSECPDGGDPALSTSAWKSGSKRRSVSTSSESQELEERRRINDSSEQDLTEGIFSARDDTFPSSPGAEQERETRRIPGPTGTPPEQQPSERQPSGDHEQTSSQSELPSPNAPATEPAQGRREESGSASLKADGNLDGGKGHTGSKAVPQSARHPPSLTLHTSALNFDRIQTDRAVVPFVNASDRREHSMPAAVRTIPGTGATNTATAAGTLAISASAAIVGPRRSKASSLSLAARTPRTPRLVGGSSAGACFEMSSKVSKRLSEALDFAAVNGDSVSGAAAVTAAAASATTTR